MRHVLCADRAYIEPGAAAIPTAAMVRVSVSVMVRRLGFGLEIGLGFRVVGLGRGKIHRSRIRYLSKKIREF